MTDRYQSTTLRLLPAGATVAGWDIFLPLDQRALFTAHEKCGLGDCTRELRLEGVLLLLQKLLERLGALPG